MIPRLVLALGVLAVTSVGAIAADLPRKAPAYTSPPLPPVFNWTGFYVGGGLGLRSTETDWDSTFLCVFGGCPGNNVLTSGNTPEPLNGTAFRYSGYLGYNWQFAPQWLVGVEGDIGGGNKTVTITGTGLPGGIPNPGDSFGVKTTWDASARARLGWLPNPDLLLYVTGGGAWQHLEAFRNFCVGCGSPLAFSSNVDDTRTGWTVGAGAEYRIWGNLLGRAEYRYADFGTTSFTDGDANRTANYDIDLKTHTVTFGLAYKFF